jgi:hypothetical protein
MICPVSSPKNLQEEKFSWDDICKHSLREKVFSQLNAGEQLMEEFALFQVPKFLIAKFKAALRVSALTRKVTFI